MVGWSFTMLHIKMWFIRGSRILWTVTHTSPILEKLKLMCHRFLRLLCFFYGKKAILFVLLTQLNAYVIMGSVIKMNTHHKSVTLCCETSIYLGANYRVWAYLVSCQGFAAALAASAHFFFVFFASRLPGYPLSYCILRDESTAYASLSH